MLTAFDLINEHPLFHEQKYDAHESYVRVKSQAQRHTRYSSQNDVVSKARPNEPEEIQEYRKENYRQLTYEGTQAWHAMLNRIFVQTGVSLDSASNELSEWLNRKPFVIQGQRMSLFDWAFRYLLPISTEDPNALLVALPVNPNNPQISPNNDDDPLQPNQQAGVDVLIVPSGDRIPVHNDILAFKGGYILKEYKGEVREVPYFYVADYMSWYSYEPTTYDEKIGKWNYQLFPWYAHNMDELPINVLCGEIVDEGTYVYHESYFKVYFEYADEFISSFSDNQGVRLRFMHPKVSMEPVSCMTCNGTTKVKSYGPDGTPKMNVCSDCGGTGIMREAGPYGTYIRESEKTGGQNFMTFHTPDVDILKMSYDVCFDLLQKGKNARGIDLLQNVAESGVAMEKRLEKLQDTIQQVATGFIDVLERFLWQVENILVLNSEQRPYIERPKNFTLKTASMVCKEMEECPAAARMHKYFEYVGIEFRGDQVLQRIHRLAAMWSPLFLMNDEEIKTKVAILGAFKTNDVIKKEYALTVFQRLSEDNDFMVTDDSILFERADELIQGLGVLQPEALPLLGNE
jgi:hypothetical protein